MPAWTWLSTIRSSGNWRPKIACAGERPIFVRQRLRIDPQAQALVALLRHGLHQGRVDTLEAESLALVLARRALGPHTSHAAGASFGQQRLVDRIKLVLAGDLARRWTLH